MIVLPFPYPSPRLSKTLAFLIAVTVMNFKDMAEVAQTIAYLRPQTPETIAALDRDDNMPWQYTVSIPSKPTNAPLEGTLDNRTACQLLVPDVELGDASRETTPGFYSPSSRVFRLRFDYTQDPSPRGFVFGSDSGSNVKVPYYGKKGKRSNQNSDLEYFKIHYNFSSGALLVTTLDKMRVGSVILEPNQSLLVMASMLIECGGCFQFLVEFPDFIGCAMEHEKNYFQYAAKLGVSNAQYMPTPSADDALIGHEHLSKAVLGKGTFGEVHKAINIKDGKKFAIKILKNGSDAEVKEVRIMSRLRHVSSFVRFPIYKLTLAKENIIQYHEAFRLPNGNICIVMELAVNDLLTHLKARKVGRRKLPLSLQAIRAIARQALEGLDYLHNKDVTHRDIKPGNMLVTKWNTQNDTPTIKLADFGLAGVGPEHKTFCGTAGYVAPEVQQAYHRLKELEKLRDKGMKTVPGNRLFRYNRSIDIWALGKVLQELLDVIPAYIPGRSFPQNKQPALRLIRQMMQEDPKRRPTAADCLRDSWIAIHGPGDGPMAQKRERSPTQPTSSTGQRVQKMIRKASADSVPSRQGPTSILMKGKWANPTLNSQSLAAPPIPGDTEVEDVLLGKTPQMRPIDQGVQLTMRFEGTQLSVTADNHSQTDLEVSPSMRYVMERLQAAFEAEGSGNNPTAAGHDPVVSGLRRKVSSLNISFAQKPSHSNVAETQVKNEEWMNSFLSDLLQPPLDQGMGSAPATAATQGSRVQSSNQGLFNQFPLPLLSLDKPRVSWQETIALHRDPDDTLSSFPVSRSDQSWDTDPSKLVTYPSNYHDPTAGMRL